MKLVRWSFNGLHMPMMMDQSGILWCTSKQLCDGLGVDGDTLRWMRKNHRDEFEGLSVNEIHAKEFLLKNKIELGIKRVRKDMSLWSENDMILVALLARSSASKQFRRELVAFVKENAIRDVLTGYVRREDYDKMAATLGKLTVRTENLERLIKSKDRNHLSVV